MQNIENRVFANMIDMNKFSCARFYYVSNN